MIVNGNSIAQCVIKIKNAIMINVNVAVKSLERARKIIVRSLAHVFVKIVGI